VLDTNDRMVSIKEAAILTKLNIKRIYKAVNTRELRSYRFGPKSTRLLLSELQHWWKTQQIKSMNFPGSW
jgi:excisionase family DNA binding protein